MKERADMMEYLCQKFEEFSDDKDVKNAHHNLNCLYKRVKFIYYQVKDGDLDAEEGLIEFKRIAEEEYENIEKIKDAPVV